MALKPNTRPFTLLRSSELGPGPVWELPDDRGTTLYQLELPPGAVVTLYASLDGKRFHPIRHASYSQMVSHHEPHRYVRADYRLYNDPCVLEVPEVEVICTWGK